MKLTGEILYITVFFQIVTSYPSPLCPEQCYCNFHFATCTNGSLSILPNGLDKDIPSLDLSFNNFQDFPSDWTILNNLIFLNLSNNKLDKLENPIYGLEYLERLDLSHNRFSTWAYINLEYFTNLKLNFLDLSYNELRASPQRNQLAINSLKILHLKNCSIRILNNTVLETLPNLIELHLSDNPVALLNSTLSSNSLKFLDLSRCNLKVIERTVFENLKSLETLLMYSNINLKQFRCNSESLLYLDLTSCNLELLPTGQLPNVNIAHLGGNHLRIIPNNSFENFVNLKNLYLNDNALTVVNNNAFSKLNYIEVIDLSSNRLANLNMFLFFTNKMLREINLSHNYFQKLPGLVTDSLDELDISSCEITRVDRTSLTGMSKLRRLNLSKNMLSSLPDYLEGDTLQDLDVSMCHITNINNKTFTRMLSLRELNLSGNRLTATTPNNYERVTTLDITDNPWRCDCDNIKEMYDWLVKTGKETGNLKCQSPDRYEGLLWSTACQNSWHPELIKKDSIWWYTTAVILTVFFILLIILITRRIYLLKEKRIREADTQRRNDEREALRRMHRMQAEYREQRETVNAPDPGELNPPSYTEALLLPKLDASHPSLAGSLHSLASKQSLSNSNTDVRSRPRRKRRRRKSNSSEGQRASRVVVDSDSSEQEQPEPRTTLESDF